MVFEKIIDFFKKILSVDVASDSRPTGWAVYQNNNVAYQLKLARAIESNLKRTALVGGLDAEGIVKREQLIDVYSRSYEELFHVVDSELLSIKAGVKLSERAYKQIGEFELYTAADSPAVFVFKDGRLVSRGLIPGQYGQLDIGTHSTVVKRSTPETGTTGIIAEVAHLGAMLNSVCLNFELFQGGYRDESIGSNIKAVSQRQLGFGETAKQVVSAFETGDFSETDKKSPSYWQYYAWSHPFQLIYPFESSVNLFYRLPPVAPLGIELYMRNTAAYDLDHGQVVPGHLNRAQWAARLKATTQRIKHAVWTVEALRALNKIYEVDKTEWCRYARAWGIPTIKDSHLSTWQARQGLIRERSSWLKVYRYMFHDGGAVKPEFRLTRAQWERYAEYIMTAAAAPGSGAQYVKEERNAFDLPASLEQMGPRYDFISDAFQEKYKNISNQYWTIAANKIQQQEAKAAAVFALVVKSIMSVVTMGASMMSSGTDIASLLTSTSQTFRDAVKNAPELLKAKIENLLTGDISNMHTFFQSQQMEIIEAANRTLGLGPKMIEKGAALARSFEGVPNWSDFSNLTPQDLLDDVTQGIDDAFDDGYTFVDDCAGKIIPYKKLNDLDSDLAAGYRANVSEYVHNQGSGVLSFKDKIQKF